MPEVIRITFPIKQSDEIDDNKNNVLILQMQHLVNFEFNDFKTDRLFYNDLIDDMINILNSMKIKIIE